MPVKRKRKFKEAKPITPPEAELTRIREALIERYSKQSHLLKEGESAENRADSIIQKACDGYTCAPKTFVGRVKALSHWNDVELYVVPTKSGQENLYNQARAKKIADTIKASEKKLYPGISGKELRSTLESEERKFWAEREKKYRDEYDLNDSSDWPLLLQVLLEELTQRRLTLKKLRDPDIDLNEELNDSYKRLINALKALGITREQRRKDFDEGSENIASLSLAYEEKLRRIAAAKERDAMEEESKQKQHDNREGYKDLPEDIRNIMMESLDYDD